MRYVEKGYRDSFFIMSMMPNRKTDTNNDGGFSSDFIGRNYDYPNATYQQREKLVNDHKTYQLGLLWTVANHPRVPQEVREEWQKWGLAKDEFTDMEPVFMILGQSAATAAGLAIDKNVPVQDIEYSDLYERLIADKQILSQ